jgi:metal-sulfur cluster biosynthetic enzyme
MGSTLITEDAVMEALRECYDPEIPVNIVDLGLVYAVRINDGAVEVDFTLTAPGCSMSGMIREDIRTRLLQLEGIADAVVNIVWDPLWTPDKMSEDARKALGFG